MMKRFMIVSLCVCGCVLGSFSCRSKEGAEKASVAVRVDDMVITQGEVDRALNNVAFQFGGKIAPEQVEQLREAFRPQVMDNLINRKLLLREADRKKIQPLKEEIDIQIAQIKSRATPEEFEKRLDEAGMTDEEFRREFEEGSRIESLLKSQTDKIKQASTEEVEKYYKDNSEKFRMPEQVSASHILIAVDQDETPEKREEKRKELAAIRERIVKGEEFASLAKEHSTCPSKSNGGDLGYFGKGSMAKPFEDAAFGMKAGELSDIVETQFGYHLIKLDDRKDAKVFTLEESKDRIATFLNNQKRYEIITSYLDALRKSATINYPETSTPAAPVAQQEKPGKE